MTDETIEAVKEAIAGALGDAYDCLRVWEAWSVGTMSAQDFVQVADDDERLDEIARAAIAALTVTPQEAAKALAVEARNEWAAQCESAEAMGQQLKGWDALSYLERSRMVTHKFAAALRAISEDSQ